MGSVQAGRVDERLDAVFSDGSLKGLVGLLIVREGLVPDGMATLVVDDLKGPLVIGAGEPVDVDLNGAPVTRDGSTER